MSIDELEREFDRPTSAVQARSSAYADNKDKTTTPKQVSPSPNFKKKKVEDIVEKSKASGSDADAVTPVTKKDDIWRQTTYVETPTAKSKLSSE